MDRVIVAINALAGLFLILSAGVVARSIRRRGLPSQVGLFLVLPLAIVMFVVIGNVLEHGGIDAGMDRVEEYLEVLIVPFFLLFVYAVGTEYQLAARRRNEASLEAALDERSALLREIHHRVKNNLQVVASLIQLQKGAAQNPSAVEHIAAMAARVETMSLLFKHASGADDLTTVRLDTYLANVVSQGMQEYRLPVGRIRTDISVPGIDTSTETALQCGLVVNELTSNTVRRVLHTEETTAIRVDVSPTEDAGLRLAFHVFGMPQESWTDDENLSFALVDALAAQLGGRLETVMDRGLSFVIDFPYRDDADRRYSIQE